MLGIWDHNVGDCGRYIPKTRSVESFRTGSMYLRFQYSGSNNFRRNGRSAMAVGSYTCMYIDI